MPFLRFTTVRTSQILLILTFGKNFKNYKKKKIFCSRWKVWKLKKTKCLKSILKFKKLTIKSNVKSMYSEKNMLWKETEPPTRKINPWISSRKSWRKEELIPLWFNKEWEIEADPNPWPKSNKSASRLAAIWWMRMNKEELKSETESEKLPDLDPKDTTDKLHRLKSKARKVSTSSVRNGERWTRRASLIDSWVQKCRSTCSQAKPVKVQEIGDDWLILSSCAN